MEEQEMEAKSETTTTKEKIMYSRVEMEALRFSEAAEQTELWISLYDGLDPCVRHDYDGLANANPNRKKKNKKNKTKTKLEPEPEPEITAAVEDVVDWDDYSDDDDEDEYHGSIQRLAFVVHGEPDFDSGPPQDGLEYLRRVRWEAANIPRVSVAKVDDQLLKEQSEYMPLIPPIPTCPPHLLPTSHWQHSFLSLFSLLREALSRLEISSAQRCGDILSPAYSTPLEESGDVNVLHDLATVVAQLHSLHIPALSASETENQNELENESESIAMSDVNEDGALYSLLSTMGKMDSVARVSMLKKRISSFGDMTALSKDDCLSLFALCAVVDTPLHADTCASLRSLLRKTACLLAEKSEIDDEVVMLNVLVTIAGRYFGQSES